MASSQYPVSSGGESARHPLRSDDHPIIEGGGEGWALPSPRPAVRSSRPLRLAKCWRAAAAGLIACPENPWVRCRSGSRRHLSVWWPHPPYSRKWSSLQAGTSVADEHQGHPLSLEDSHQFPVASSVSSTQSLSVSTSGRDYSSPPCRCRRRPPGHAGRSATQVRLFARIHGCSCTHPRQLGVCWPLHPGILCGHHCLLS